MSRQDYINKTLKTIEGRPLSFRQIAEEIGIPMNNVVARSRLMDVLDEQRKGGVIDIAIDRREADEDPEGMAARVNRYRYFLVSEGVALQEAGKLSEEKEVHVGGIDLKSAADFLDGGLGERAHYRHFSREGGRRVERIA